MAHHLRTRLIAVATAILTAAAVAAVCPPAFAQSPGSNGLIAWVQNNTLVTANADGSDRRELVGSSYLTWIAWSPDGNRIAFIADTGGVGELWVVDADGTDPVQLTADGVDKQEINWSPDGTRLVMEESGNIATVAADGTGAQVLTTTGCDYTPNWSPDSKTVIFGRYCGAAGLYTMPADGSTSPVELTSSQHLWPDYSPDGTSIVYLDGPDQTGRTISTINADGTNPRTIALPEDVTYPAGTSFSPDGTKILFAANSATIPGGNRDLHVFTVGVDGSGLAEVDGDTNDGDQNYYTSWQPVGPTTNARAGSPAAPGAFQTTMIGGGSYSTGAAPSPQAPVQTQISADGVSGTLSVTPRSTTTTPPSGFILFGTELVIDAPPSTPDHYYSAQFTIDGSTLNGTDPQAVDVFRNGVRVPDCLDPFADAPDPCVRNRGISNIDPTDAVITVLTSHFSTWNLGTSLVVNHAPVANDPMYTTGVGQAVAVPLSATDDDGDALTYSVKSGSGPTGGTLSGTAPNLTYTPDPGFVGNDSFQFIVTDGHRNATGSVSIAVQPVTDEPPTADNVAVSTSKNTKTPVSLVAADPDGDHLTYTVGAPAHGKLTGTAPELTYTPTTGFTGTDTFTYSVSDGTASSPAATVTITVAGTNHPPVAHSALAITRIGRPVSVTLRGTDADGDALTYVHAAAVHGTVSGSGRSLTYTPNAGFTGLDSFTYTVNDGKVTSSKATVVILVTPNHRPIANPQKVSVTAGRSITVTLSGWDADRDPLTFLAGHASHGTVSVIGSKAVYTPAKGFTGTDSFAFTVFDGSLTSSAAMVAITVRPAR